MAKVVYGSGSVTVAVDGTLERTLREAVRAASRGIADSIEALFLLSAYASCCIRQHTSAYASIRQHTSLLPVARVAPLPST
jgi:hypothetical protein